MRRVALALAPLLLAAAASAQEVDHSHMPGMAPAASGANQDAPTWTRDHAADRYFDLHSMEHARAMMREEMGGMRFSKFMLNLAEYQPHAGNDAYRWDARGWIGGDIDRLVLRSEGEGVSGEGVQTGDVQALYSRAVSRYTDVQLGVRQDLEPRGRTYLSAGAQSLFPYWFEIDGALFLSTRGELLARAEGSYEVQLLQRLVLEPRIELNLAAQDTAATRTGSGLSSGEFGLRLRYEIRREFAPYLGISWESRFGATADYWRAAGEKSHSTHLVLGLRAWF
jgi:copper resistance protein B